MRAVGQVLGYDTRSQRPRETSLPLLTTTREILTEAGLLKNTQGRLRLGESGARLLSGGASLDELHLAMSHGFEETFGAHEWRAVVKWIANENGIIASGPQRVPADLAGTYDLLRALGVVE
ncbi:hypothetical protein H0H28_04210, partial [Corynebacterium sanguinis]|nr:hypothetical protein [Corynebacterium sanguinis]